MLSSKQKKYLKALAHKLKPVVIIGKKGLEVPVKKALDQELLAHELIKVKLLESFETPRYEAAPQVAEFAGAELVNLIGRTIILYRPHPEEPEIVLP